jgi:uncharacterized protein YecE (DUF72 family)
MGAAVAEIDQVKVPPSPVAQPARAAVSSSPLQQSLFGGAVPEPPIVEPAIPDEELVRIARRVPKNAHLGTSSWSFPGWVNTVYGALYPVATLARHGLPAYARHPLMRCAGLDSPFYRPLTSEQFARYAGQVPEDFRFIVKAFSGLTTSPDSARGARMKGEPVFLDARHARSVLAPMVEGLGPRLGAVLFQFSPPGPRHTRSPGSFANQLEGFLSELAVGPLYAIELRDPELLGQEYERALAATGAVHCASVHSRMPPVDQQVSDTGRGPLIIRWMLGAGDDYQSASARFSPFDRLTRPDELNRNRVAGMILKAVSSDRDVHVVAANNAEGSAPLTVRELAKTLVQRSTGRDW